MQEKMLDQIIEAFVIFAKICYIFVKQAHSQPITWTKMM
jgi:hypothetical protein